MLQWTLRDGAQVNLPWALLVKDDVIMVKPGQGFNLTHNTHLLLIISINVEFLVYYLR